MKWFAMRQSADIWDEPMEGPIGDIEAAERIRNICRAARAGGEAVGASAQTAKRERERYERAARVAMEIAMKISDDLMRDDAVRRIVDLCIKANDFKTAQILFRAIQTGWAGEDVQRDHPALTQ